MKKRVFGDVLIVLGVLMVLASLALTMYNLYEDELVGSRTLNPDDIISLDTLGDSYKDEAYVPDYQLDGNFEMPVVNLDGWDYIGRVDIPDLNLSLPVLSELTYPGLKISPARYQGSVYDGDFIVGAHNYNSHFGRLKTLNPGNELSFTDVDGNRFNYVISEMTTLDGYDVDGLVSGDWDMTLFTCTYGGKSRVIVRCELVSENLIGNEAEAV